MKCSLCLALQLEKLTVAALKEFLEAQGVSGLSRLTKAALIDKVKGILGAASAPGST
jgi:hypothetical protein